VLLYEKLLHEDDDCAYNESKYFSLTRSKLEEFSFLANDLDRLANASIEDLYDADEME